MCVLHHIHIDNPSAFLSKSLSCLFFEREKHILKMSPSLAQYPPILILKSIFALLLDSRPAANGHGSPIRHIISSGQDARQAPIVANTLSLTGVCSIWREVALTMLFESAVLEDPPPTPVPAGVYPRWIWPSKVQTSLPSAIYLGIVNNVRSMNMDFAVRRIVNGASLAGLTNGPISGKVYPLVTTLNVTLGSGVGINNRILNTREGAEKFCDVIAKAFPNSRAMTIVMDEERWNKINGVFLDCLFQQLLKGHTSIKVTQNITHPVPTNYDTIMPEFSRPLTKIALDDVRYESVVFDVIRRHSSTLESLELRVGLAWSMYSILYDEDENAVLYPRLRKLSLSENDGQDEHLDGFESGVPWFPVLEDLRCETESTQIQQLFIEEFSHTLKRVLLRISMFCYHQLNINGVFANREYPILEHLSMSYPKRDEESLPTITNALQIGRNASVIVSDGGADIEFGLIRDHFSRTSPWLRRFETTSVYATLEETLGLIKEKPFLNYLGIFIEYPAVHLTRFAAHSGCYDQCNTGRESEPKQKQEQEQEQEEPPNLNIECFINLHMDVICAQNDYIESLFKRHHPVSERLHTFDAAEYCYYHAEDSLVNVSVLLVHLALLCPSISLIYWDMNEQKYALSRSQLRQHASFQAMEEHLLSLVSDSPDQ